MTERCGWVTDDPQYILYHDQEWGRPERDGKKLFEKLVLESFQSGLSWLTILRKREGFRRAFAGFEPEVIAGWGAAEVETLLQDASIVRHRGKVEATLSNAAVWCAIEHEEGFSQFIWSYVDHTPLRPQRASLSDVPAQTDLSKRLSRDLNARGMKFFGPTTAYAFMQAAGLVNDHVMSCPTFAEIAEEPVDPSGNSA